MHNTKKRVKTGDVVAENKTVKFIYEYKDEDDCKCPNIIINMDNPKEKMKKSLLRYFTIYSPGDKKEIYCSKNINDYFSFDFKDLDKAEEIGLGSKKDRKQVLAIYVEDSNPRGGAYSVLIPYRVIGFRIDNENIYF